MKLFRWGVTLDGKTVVVKAEDRLKATKKAAKLFGVLWSARARDMVVVKLGSAKK